MKMNISDRVMFVNSVVDMSKASGRYEPALYDYAFRINVAIFFTDIDTADKTMDELSDIAFSDEIDAIINDSKNASLIGSLNSACREKIKIENDLYKIAYETTMKNEPWEAIVDIIDDFAKQFDLKKIARTIVRERIKNDNSRIQAERPVVVVPDEKKQIEPGPKKKIIKKAADSIGK